MNLDLTPDQILDRASKVIERQGIWCQRHVGHLDMAGNLVSACAIGAIRYVVVGDPSPDSDTKLMWLPNVQDAVNVLSEHVNQHVADWNDDKATSAEEVATAMREAAADWRIRNANS